MGAEPYYYFVKYQSDITNALQELREREFKAGRYFPAMFELQFPPTEDSPEPGAQHASIEEVLEDAQEEGTRSILDIFRITDEPDLMAAAPLPSESLKEIYDTDRPTRQAVEANLDFFDELDRGCAAYFIIYKDDHPDEILFAGYSFD